LCTGGERHQGQKSIRWTTRASTHEGDGIYTNTTGRDVNFGQNTSDEMCFNFAAYYPRGALSCGGLGGLIGGGGAAGSGRFIGGF
jgi:hypothetical protein